MHLIQFFDALKSFQSRHENVHVALSWNGGTLKEEILPYGRCAPDRLFTQGNSLVLDLNRPVEHKPTSIWDFFKGRKGPIITDTMPLKDFLKILKPLIEKSPNLLIIAMGRDVNPEYGGRAITKLIPVYENGRTVVELSTWLDSRDGEIFL